ncbi:MAG: radical SAM protein [Acidobacteriota bacterium]|nr:radical SAM protein [Acidobacteriota bacterium]
MSDSPANHSGPPVAENEAVDGDIVFSGRSLPRNDSEIDAFNALELKEMQARDFVPREVHIQVSRRCNLQCVMCSWQTWKSNTGLMETALFEHILADAKRAGVRKVVFGNAQGEPFLHPKINDMLERSVAEGFWTMVSTNGTPLTTKRIQRLARGGIHNIQFSFAGYNKTVYEQVYAGAKWEQVTRNLQELAAELNRAEADTTLVINGCYAVELEGVVDPNTFIARTRAYLSSIGVGGAGRQIVIQLPHNFGGNIETGAVGSTRVTSNFKVPTGRPGLCRVLKNGPGIYADGRVTACGCLDPNGDLLIGDINRAGIADIRKQAPFQNILETFISGNVEDLPLCAGCDIPYYERPDASPRIWQRIVDEYPDPAPPGSFSTAELDERYQQTLEDILHRAAGKQGLTGDEKTAFVHKLVGEVTHLCHLRAEAAHAVSHRLFTDFREEDVIDKAFGRPVRKIGLAPATKIVLENLNWFQERFDEVLVGDNFKAGQTHHGQTVLTIDSLMEKADDLDAFLLTTNTPDIEPIFLNILPPEKTILISQVSARISSLQFQRSGLARAKRILSEIEAANNPVVVLGAKLLATAEPTFLALENAGYDVFVISLFDKMENVDRSGHDEQCAVFRNALVSPYEQLYILTHLQKGLFFIYYDFFYNAGWDARKCLITYGNAAAMTALAARPVIMGMYDIIKPICLNMDRSAEAFALYKVLFDVTDAVALTSKSDHIAEYLRNTLIKHKPVISFYRYSLPPEAPLRRLSEDDGERHLVGVTSFLGEVYEPNRIETRDSIRSILRQKIHFHYYSDHPNVRAFRESLPAGEQAYFHIEKAIWDQRALVHHMSRYDGGWLVGDEATIFARLISQVEDRTIRELYTLFVPNGVSTSSMTYGAAGLPVFISRQIKVMDEVYPKGCCIPLDIGEVDNLAAIFDRLDWKTIHETMRRERSRFNAFDQIPRFAAFLDQLSRKTGNS